MRVREVISENSAPAPFFSIRIRLKPLRLALQNFSAPIGEREKIELRGFSKML